MDENTLSRLKEAIEQLEGYQEIAQSGHINEILYDLHIVQAELEGKERPEKEDKMFKSWLGFGLKYEVELIRLNWAEKDNESLGTCPLDTFSYDSLVKAKEFGESHIGEVRWIPGFWGAEYNNASYCALHVGYRINSGGKTIEEVLDKDLIEKLRKINFVDGMIEKRSKKLAKVLGYAWW